MIRNLQLRALAGPLRDAIHDLLLERAATVSELASALGRPKSTVASLRRRTRTDL